MKKKNLIILVLLLLVIFITIGTILFINYNNSKKEVEYLDEPVTVAFDEVFLKLTSIFIRTSSITNMEDYTYINFLISNNLDTDIVGDTVSLVISTDKGEFDIELDYQDILVSQEVYSGVKIDGNDHTKVTSIKIKE